jgi:ribose-phosphate pyrophosphokinase
VAERVIVGGPASQELANSLSKRLKLPLLSLDVAEFADGETKIKFNENVEGVHAILVQSTYPPVDKHLMQLFLVAHHLSQEGARIHAVIPYLAYARQDKQFLRGEVVSLGVVSHLLRSVGVGRIITVDIHSVEGLSLFSIPTYSVSAIPSMVQYIKKNVSVSNPAVIAPDFGSSKRTEAFATLFGAEYIQLSKQRDRLTGKVKIEAQDLKIKNRDVIIVDDIISTGGTIMAASEMLRKAGAGRIIVTCVHPLLVKDAYEKLIAAGVDEILGTNTVPSKVSKIDAAEVIMSHLATLTE